MTSSIVSGAKGFSSALQAPGNDIDTAAQTSISDNAAGPDRPLRLCPPELMLMKIIRNIPAFQYTSIPGGILIHYPAMMNVIVGMISFFDWPVKLERFIVAIYSSVHLSSLSR
jgi:hypothetical protein